MSQQVGGDRILGTGETRALCSITGSPPRMGVGGSDYRCEEDSRCGLRFAEPFLLIALIVSVKQEVRSAAKGEAGAKRYWKCDKGRMEIFTWEAGENELGKWCCARVPMAHGRSLRDLPAEIDGVFAATFSHTARNG